jgi:D-amino-acid dehydrogenase
MKADATPVPRQPGASRSAIVIGAGVIGLSTALYLQRDGWHVTIVDPEPPGEAGASFGNAGLIATHIVQPIATQSILPKIPKMLFDETAPLAIRWRYLPTVLPWLIRLLRATRPAEVERIAAALASELRHAEAAFGPLLDDPATTGLFNKKGVLIVYPDEQCLAENEPVFDLQRRNGVRFNTMGHNEVHNLVPDLSSHYRFGVHYVDAGHVSDPLAFVKALLAQFQRAGGVLKATRATGFAMANGRVSAVQTDAGSEPADLVVVAAGIWSKPLAAQLGSRIPLESERGYHVTLAEPGIAVDMAMMIGDIRFAVAPMRMGLRLAGTIEFAGLKAGPNPKRHDALINNARRVFPGLKSEKQTRWMGHRPSLPDSMPIVGPSPRYRNVFFNFGHGHLGLTSAAVTGRTIADLAAGREPLFDPAPFSAARF